MKDPEIMPFMSKGRYEQDKAPDQKKQPQHKLILLAIVALLGAEFINIALWQLGAIPSCPSIFVSEIITGVIAFLAGLAYERFSR